MQKKFEIEQGVPEKWEFKGSEIILLCETKKRKKYHCAAARALCDRSFARIHVG